MAIFTSERALAQAEELTSHMKEKTTVTTKSWGTQNTATPSKKGVSQASYLRDHCTHNERPPVVLAVLVLKEDVDDGGHEGVQEGKNSNGDEKLCRGRVVSGEEHTFSPYPLTRGGFKGHLVQPETAEQEQGSRQEPPARCQTGCS